MVDDVKILSYQTGTLFRRGGPDWFAIHLAQTSDDWQKSLKDCGVEEIESFGDVGDTITIYRAPSGYYVEYADVHEIAAHIFIEETSDYLHFRIHWIKPLVELITLSDEHTAKEVTRTSVLESDKSH